MPHVGMQEYCPYLKYEVLLDCMVSDSGSWELTSSESMEIMLTARRAVFSTTPNQGAYAVVGLHNTRIDGVLSTRLVCSQSAQYTEPGTQAILGRGRHV